MSTFSAYLVLLRKLDEARRDRGEFDRFTWDSVDDEVLSNPGLSAGQALQLHGHILQAIEEEERTPVEVRDPRMTRSRWTYVPEEGSHEAPR